MRGRRLVARLAEPDVTPEEIAEGAGHGREALIDLFRLLGTSTDIALRQAAGRAIAAIWKGDNLVAEEERALVLRGFQADWKARRRYPRGLTAPIPIRVEFGVPFLRDVEGEVGPGDLAWSYRIGGAQRASLEEFTAWRKGPSAASFTINPEDFAANGPHRLVLQARVSTSGLSDAWELDLPHIPFSFELDPLLDVDALLTMPDETRGAQMARSIALRAGAESGVFVPVGPEILLRDPPAIVVTTPMPADLAHRVEVEFEGHPGRLPAGLVVVSGQGAGASTGEVVVPLDLPSRTADALFERPGEVRLRAILTADPQRGWADPDVRSIWPGTITTEWTTARLVRR